MLKTTIFGLPLNPMPKLDALKGSSFCVSFATRDKLGRQLDQAISLVGEDGILLVDNGAYTMWGKGERFTDAQLDAFHAWAWDILDRCPQAVVVIPDVIGGSELENKALLEKCAFDMFRSMPVWHMHESLDYLIQLCQDYNYVAFGSTKDKPGTEAWHARIREAFAAIEAWETETGFNRPRIHMMRAQAQAHLYDFDSSDSTNVAQNHNRQLNRTGETLTDLAYRIDGKIQRSCDGHDSAHQELRPLLFHVEAARHDTLFWFEMQLAAMQGDEPDDTPPAAPVVAPAQIIVDSVGSDCLYISPAAHFRAQGDDHMAFISEQLINDAVDAIITTRDFCGDERAAVRELAVEAGIRSADWQRFWRVANFRANARWNGYQRAAGVPEKYLF